MAFAVHGNGNCNALFPFRRLTNTFCWHLSGIATLYSDKLTNVTTSDPEIQTNSLITNIFLEVCTGRPTNSRSLSIACGVYVNVISQSIDFCFAIFFRHFNSTGFQEYVIRAKWVSTIYSNSTSWRCLICRMCLWWMDGWVCVHANPNSPIFSCT